MKDKRYRIVLLGNPGTGKTRCPTVLTGLLTVNTSGKTTVARLYAKFLTSMGILLGNGFVKTLGSRLANDRVTRAKKHIKTLINTGRSIFFLNKAY